MSVYNANQFWLRYKGITKRDCPVIKNTGIPASTLSTWKSKNIFPRADEAVKIAMALNTSVEYLVTGEISYIFTYSPDVLEIANDAAKLNDEGIKTLKYFISSLKNHYT